MMSEEQRREYEKLLDEKFDQLLKEGYDIREFLYAPPESLTPKIKSHLDKLLQETAYEMIFADESCVEPGKNMNIYTDDKSVIFMETQEKKAETLRRMLEYYETHQDFEKCSRISKLIEKVEPTTNQK